MDKMFKALADSSRRELLDRLHAKGGLTLTELCRRHDMTRQAVAKHLAPLEAANLVVTVWHGREKLHYLNPVPIHEMTERWIGKYERTRLAALSELKKRLEEHKDDDAGSCLRDVHRHRAGQGLAMSCASPSWNPTMNRCLTSTRKADGAAGR